MQFKLLLFDTHEANYFIIKNFLKKYNVYGDENH